MDLSRPATTLLGRLDAAALGVLYRSQLPLTVREVHRLSSAGSYEGIRLSLRRLAQSGLLQVEERTAGSFYSLNRAHLAYSAVETLFTVRPRLATLVAGAIEEWNPRPQHASLFGSIARGDGGPDSDVDLLVVFDDVDYQQEGRWSEAVADLEAAIRGWTGNRASVLTMGLADVRAMAAGRRARPLWKALRAEALTVYGKDLTRLLR